MRTPLSRRNQPVALATPAETAPVPDSAPSPPEPPRPPDRSEHPRRRGALLATAWVTSTVVIGAVILGSRTLGPESATKLLLAVLLNGATTAALLYWLRRPPTEELPGAAEITRRGRLTGLIAAAALLLFAAGLLGLPVLILLAAAAAAVLVVVHREIRRREVGYALILGVIAAGAGVLDGVARGDRNGVLFGVLQLPLVLVCLLAGWALARRAGWMPPRIGPSIALTAGWRPALRLAAVAFVFALPWALGNIINGPLEEDHVTRAWDPVAAAVQPGVAEEAWGRVFLIAALYMLFRRTARANTALLAAAILGTVWFAFVHMPANPVGTVLFAAVYALPMTWLFLRRGLEAAIGFHICTDLVRYGAAFIAFQGLWFT